MITIYISGHKGFVGSNVLEHFKKLDYRIITKTRQQLDLLNQYQVKHFFNVNEIDIVINCSAIVGGIQANINNPYKFLFENLQIQNNLINYAKDKVKTFVNLGSSCVFPKDYKQPLKEEYLLGGYLEPTNEAYSLAKICGLKLCEYANKESSTNFINLMPCNIYGEYDDFDPINSHMLSALIRKVYDAKINNKDKIITWGSGKAKRELLYIKDLVNCIQWSINNDIRTETFLNVGTGNDISINELTDIIINKMDIDIKIEHDLSKPDGMLKKCLDVSKINNLGWKAETTLKDGLENTIKWYEENYDKLS